MHPSPSLSAASLYYSVMQRDIVAKRSQRKKLIVESHSPTERKIRVLVKISKKFSFYLRYKLTWKKVREELCLKKKVEIWTRGRGGGSSRKESSKENKKKKKKNNTRNCTRLQITKKHQNYDNTWKCVVDIFYSSWEK